MAPRLDVERLSELLAEGHEYEGLDYKLTADPGVRRDLIELVKDLGAFAAESGYIVVGVENHGAPVGIDPAMARREFDEATLRGRVRRYLPDIDLRCAVHEIDDRTLGLIWVGQHATGFAIFAVDGQFEDETGRTTTVFREGDVYIRRGTASVKANHRDMERLRERFIERERTRVRREWAADVTGLQMPMVDRRRLDWEMPIDEFGAAAEELVTSGSSVPLRLLLARIKPVVSARIEVGDEGGLGEVLDRTTCLTALAVLVDVEWLFTDSVAALSTVYEVGHERFERPADAGVPAQRIWLDAAERAYALGGLAVRQQRWTMVRRLALEPGDRVPFGTLNRTWLRHALVYASRARMFTREQDGRTREISILSLAVDHARRLACLRPDQPDGGEAILDSICQFDALAGLAVISTGARIQNVYPSFGQFAERRTEPALIRMIEDPRARDLVAPLHDQDLADALRYLDRSATQQFFRNWDHYYSETINRFLEEHAALEPR